MKKPLAVVAVSVCAILSSGAVIAADGASAGEKKVLSEEAALEEDEPQIFEAGFDAEFFSAYVWRNSVLNDRPVIQPSVWGEFTYFEPFWIGFWIWQNYDLTDRRRECLRNSLSETDYNVHAGATLWSSDDETMSVDLEIGHEWYANMGVQRDCTEDYHDVRELYAKLSFNNEIVNVYGQVSWMYDDFGSCQRSFHYELGVNREIDILGPFELPEDKLLFGLDWNVNFGDGRYLSYLYGGTPSGAYDHGEDEGIYDDYADRPTAGIGGTTIKAYLTWNITEWMSLVGTIAYTGVLNDSSRDALDDVDSGMGWEDDKYPRDLLWWGLSLKFAF